VNGSGWHVSMFCKIVLGSSLVGCSPADVLQVEQGQKMCFMDDRQTGVLKSDRPTHRKALYFRGEVILGATSFCSWFVSLKCSMGSVF
jgi:hypothetical protein